MLQQARASQVASAAEDAPDAMAACAQLLAGREVTRAAALATSAGDVRLSLLILQARRLRGCPKTGARWSCPR